MFDLVNNNRTPQRAVALEVHEQYQDEGVEGLRKHYQRAGGVLDRTDGHQLFSNMQEDTIVGVIEAFSLANCPISRVMIIRMVRKEFKLGDKWRGDDWYVGFLGRHRVPPSARTLCSARRSQQVP